METAETTSAGTSRTLDRLFGLSVRVDVQVIAFVALMLLVLVTRFVSLEPRVMSHDEVSHVYYSYNLYRGLGFQHNPLMHGSLQFHLVALSYFLFGATDATARYPAAIAGVVAVALLWFFRRWLGKTGAIAAALLMLVSPYMLYYSRYVRNEAFVVVEGLLMFWAVFRYYETRQARWLYLLAAALALHFTTKETAFIYAAQLLLFLGIQFTLQILRRPWGNLRYKAAFVAGILMAVVGAGTAMAFFFRELLIVTEILKNGGTLPSPETGGVGSLVMGLGVLLALAGAILVVASLLAAFGRQLRTEFPALDLLIVTGTLTLTQLSALFLPAEVSARYGQTADAQSLLSPMAIQRLWIVIPVFVLVAAGVGLAWDWRRWLTAAGVFAAIYVPIYSTMFTHALGLATGAIGSLAYWLGNQGVERGTQPWYYYLGLQIPIYEFLPALAVLAAGVYALVRWWGSKGESTSEAGGDKAAEGKAPALPLLGYWCVTATLAYTYAGEKMPWLTVHIALPLILVAGWWIGRVLDSIDWSVFGERRSWLVIALLALSLTAVAGILGNLLGTNPPFDGAELNQLSATLGFITALLVGVGSMVGLFYAARGWSVSDLLKLAGVLVIATLFMLTTRASFRASYVNYDNATEFLVYAHSATGSKTILQQVEDLSRRTTDGLGIDVAYDNETSYPYMWYLREYTRVHSFGEAPGRDLLNYPVIIVGDANWARVEPILGDRYHQFEYIRMWWPMQAYAGLTWERVRQGITDRAYRTALWDIWLNRDYTAYGELTSTDYSLENWQPAARMRLYIRKDVAALVWDYGALPSSYSPEPFVDPYAERMGERTADRILGPDSSPPVSFNRPRAIALAPDGTLYVADTGNHRIIHLSSEGQELGLWGSFSGITQGEAPEGTFNEPWGVAVAPDGTVYVADTWNHRIQHFSADGQFIGMFGVYGQGETPEAFWGPRGVAVDERGRVYVADTGNKRVVVFDAQGEHVGSFGGPGYEPGRLNEPVGVAVAEDGTVFVTDTWNMRIQGLRETAAGEFQPVVEWTIEGWYGQSLDNKPYLAVAPGGQVCASDPEGYRILCFTQEGEFVLGWGAFGLLGGEFNLPSGLVFDEEGYLWVVDGGNARLMRFAPDFP